MAESDKYRRGSTGYSVADEKAAKKYSETALKDMQSTESSRSRKSSESWEEGPMAKDVRRQGPAHAGRSEGASLASATRRFLGKTEHEATGKEMSDAGRRADYIEYEEPKTRKGYRKGSSTGEWSE